MNTVEILLVFISFCLFVIAVEHVIRRISKNKQIHHDDLKIKSDKELHVNDKQHHSQHNNWGNGWELISSTDIKNFVPKKTRKRVLISSKAKERK
jgi:hypothetical protein